MTPRAGRAVLAAAFAAAALASCATSTSPVSLHALQSAGPVAFLCLGDRASGPLADFAHPLTSCPRGRVDDFSLPHVYALTTQPIRGEVAVVDLTTGQPALVDADPATPGTNFLPVGGAPTDVVTTPGSMAAFVAVAQPGYEGIFALPSDQIRGGAPLISDWPACSLPTAPGRMVVVLDPADAAGSTRPSCDAAYGANDDVKPCGSPPRAHCHGDLGVDAQSVKKPGRYKLLVALPKARGVAVIDAQAILDQQAGAFEPCRVERFVELAVKGVPAPTQPPPAPNAGCTPDPPVPLGETHFTVKPGGLAVTPRTAGGLRAFVADRGAPVIHRLDLPTPCEPTELDALLPTSVEDPTRVVTTDRVMVSPPTLDMQRTLYALDENDGSIIVFDASDAPATRTPLQRAHPEWNPFQPADRVRFGAAARDVVLVRHTADLPDDQTGATLPVRCDPHANSKAPGAKYQPAADFSSGAGPRRLRGVFAFAVLASGSVVVIDIDDFDAPCRVPVNHHPLFGCGDAELGLTGASGEYSCNVVAANQPRATAMLAFREGLTSNQPGLQAAPVLFDTTGAVLAAGATGVPRMRATVPKDALPEKVKPQFGLPVASTFRLLSSETGLFVGAEDQHALIMNYEDPRAHIVAQAWSVTFEGAVPGFVSHFAELAPSGAGFVLHDPSVRFCTLGVMGATAVADQLVAEGTSAADAATQAKTLADYVEITSDTPVPQDKYWTEQNQCTFTSCQQAYGTSLVPASGVCSFSPTDVGSCRDFRVEVARDDGLELAPRGKTPAPPVKCCFPNTVQFRVRLGGQWVVVGSQVGFLHHVAADAAGVCRPKCDPKLKRLTGRARDVVASGAKGAVHDGDPGEFQNPFFRFAINRGTTKRDMRFTFSTQTPFVPIVIGLVSNTTEVQPTAGTFLPNTGELVVADGSLQGLVFIDTGSLTVSRQYQ